METNQHCPISTHGAGKKLDFSYSCYNSKNTVKLWFNVLMAGSGDVRQVKLTKNKSCNSPDWK